MELMALHWNGLRAILVIKKSTYPSKASNPLMEVTLADDTNLFLPHENIDTLLASMNVELENV